MQRRTVSLSRPKIYPNQFVETLEQWREVNPNFNISATLFVLCGKRKIKLHFKTVR